MASRSHPFLAGVAASISRHRMADPGDRLLVGVSGGADSVCLLRVLCELGYSVGVAHVDHGLRGEESDGDMRFVRELADVLGLPFFLRREEAALEAGVNLEARARDVRRRFFRELIAEQGFRRVMLAHSRDDRVETFFLHLLRGSGPGGLVSMAPVGEWLGRPLLHATRAEIEAYLGEIGQVWRVDRTNLDTRFTRNRIRHELIPGLEARFNPRLGETVSRTIEVLAAEDAWMEAEASDWVGRHLGRGAAGPPGSAEAPWEAARLELADLGKRPVGFVRRVLRAALAAAGSDLRDVGFDHIEEVRRLLAPGRSGRVVEIPGDLSVERAFDTLVFRADQAPVTYEYELSIPGQVWIPEAGLRFEARVLGPGGPAGDAPAGSSERVRVDGESLGPCVKIRNWKNGDTYEPAGQRKSKLKTLFAERRIPRSTRLRWPVFVVRSSIVWVASFPVSSEFAPTERSRRIVEFEASPARR